MKLKDAFYCQKAVQLSKQDEHLTVYGPLHFHHTMLRDRAGTLQVDPAKLSKVAPTTAVVFCKDCFNVNIIDPLEMYNRAFALQYGVTFC